MSDWAKREVWTRRGAGFAIEVSRHEDRVSDSTLAMGEGPHRWAVYAYVYPQHPLFRSFDARAGMWQDAARDLPLHACPSLFRVHYNETGGICSFQVGADYHHLHDEPYTHMATKDEAGAVFAEAEELFNHLSLACVAPAPRDAGKE